MAEPHPGKRPAAAAAIIVAAALLAWPVIGQQSRTEPQVPASETDAPPPPRSLLPDSFEARSATANASPAPAGADTAAAPATPGQPPLIAAPINITPVIDPFASAAVSGRGIGVFGPLTLAAGGYGPATFTGSNGAFLAGLNRRMNAPIGSRWVAITLRRALLSESAAPAGIIPGDWVASRAMLLVRIGEIDGAKALVDSVPIDRYSPALYRVAAQVALAAADLGGLCPIAITGRSLSTDSLWQLAVGMCAAMQGDDITAAGIFDALRDDENAVDPFDVRLGERVATIAGGAGRASNIDWAEAPPLTLYRYGVAVAAGVAIPADKLANLGPARFGWLVRSAGVAPEIRLAALRPAAVLGSVSANELVSGIAALSPGDAAADTPAGRLRTAFAGASLRDRIGAMKAIWASGTTTGEADYGDGYGALLESASAAARLPVSANAEDESADIIAALLAAGSADAARRWWPIADKAGGKIRARAWALLATGSSGVPITPSEFKDWRSATGADERRAALLLAGLAGLGRASGGGWDGLRRDLLPRAANSWTRAIDAAAVAGRTGEVAILAATGVQDQWNKVPPLHLYHIVAALTRTGRAQEARLVAAEALTRS
jgi:hypothetical protein